MFGWELELERLLSLSKRLILFQLISPHEFHQSDKNFSSLGVWVLRSTVHFWIVSQEVITCTIRPHTCVSVLTCLFLNLPAPSPLPD